MNRFNNSVHAVAWCDDHLRLLDQRRLPREVSYLDLIEASDTAKAIREMVVRGAPAIGITAAFGVVLSARRHIEREGISPAAISAIRSDMEQLAAARPTAVNLFWALERMGNLLDSLVAEAYPKPIERLLQEAQRIQAEDVAANRRMGELGAALISGPTALITHCNAGALATGGYGTALGVVRSAWSEGKLTRVYADETRPWLQGSRLTAWELQQESIPVTVICEGAAGALLRRGEISWVVVGSDRIAANGDVANKIGTYGLAVLARHHGVRVMVAAPTSTIDRACPNGESIPIEQRAPEEVLQCGGSAIAADETAAENPVFDVTPAELIDAIVTERGVVSPPSTEGIAELFLD